MALDRCRANHTGQGLGSTAIVAIKLAITNTIIPIIMSISTTIAARITV